MSSFLTLTMATSATSSEEMVFETIPSTSRSSKSNWCFRKHNRYKIWKVVLRELTSVKLEGTEIFKKVESLIKSHYKILNDNQFLNAFDKGMELNKNNFKNIFKHFHEETKSPQLMMKNCTLLSNLRNIK